MANGLLLLSVHCTIDGKMSFLLVEIKAQDQPGNSSKIQDPIITM